MADWWRSRRPRSARPCLAPRSTSCSLWPKTASPGSGRRRSSRRDPYPAEVAILRPAMSALVLASRNPHKLRELREALPGVEIEPLPDEIQLPPEAGETFAENALAKARAAQRATGSTAIADDP